MSLFISSFILAIAFCAPPGVITAETVRRGASRGFTPALLVQLGSLVGDTTWAVIALTGLAFVVQNNTARIILSLVGVVLMLKLAWDAFKDARRGIHIEANSPSTSTRGDFATGALLSLGNPMNIVFWTGLGTTAFASIAGTPAPVHFAIFFAGFLSGATVFCFFMATLVGFGRRFLTDTFFRGVSLICGVALVYFAIQLSLAILRNPG
jgi:chemosensory pili system protein ChpE